jgi:3-hydroxyisobutyrate dehydrogenase-like beta-hydroxyacid dehydrogenase
LTSRQLPGELDHLISRIPHCHLITSPVFGAPAAADKAQLLICMSGDYRSKKEVAFLFVPAVGRKVIDLGGNLEKGDVIPEPDLSDGRSFFSLLTLVAPTIKLVGNSLLLGMLEVLAESFTLAEKSGIDSQDVQNIIKGMYSRCNADHWLMDDIVDSIY